MYIELVGGPTFENTCGGVVGCGEPVSVADSRIGHTLDGQVPVDGGLHDAYGAGGLFLCPSWLLFFSETMVLDNRVVALLPSKIESFYVFFEFDQMTHKRVKVANASTLHTSPAKAFASGISPKTSDKSIIIIDHKGMDKTNAADRVCKGRYVADFMALSPFGNMDFGD
jgi:hypothetical protein